MGAMMVSLDAFESKIFDAFDLSLFEFFDKMPSML